MGFRSRFGHLELASTGDLLSTLSLLLPESGSELIPVQNLHPNPLVFIYKVTKLIFDISLFINLLFFRFFQLDKFDLKLVVFLLNAFLLVLQYGIFTL